jgi:hypothetical protein
MGHLSRLPPIWALQDSLATLIERHPVDGHGHLFFARAPDANRVARLRSVGLLL